jgi:hypothetical protein
MMKTFKKPRAHKPGSQLALKSATLSSRDPVAYAAALKALG